MNYSLQELHKINRILEESLKVNPDNITWLVIGICGALFLLSLRVHRLRDITPTLMVSAGIIGTFWGTFIALAEFKTSSASNGFDHEAMVESIPLVLDGMKTAFVTTLVGLSAAFASKIFIKWLPQKAETPLPVEENTIELLRDIRDGISQETEASISQQLTVLRQENNASLEKLDGHISGLAETIRDSLVENIQALVEELRDVIVGQLTEQLKQTNEILRNQLGEMLDRIEEALIKQFGETFKQFNEATQAIKKWQEDHREQVEQLTAAFSVTAAGIEKIRADCESIPVAMEQLKNLMGELDDRLRAFADMKKSAEESFPLIKQHLDAIGSDLQKSATGFSGLEETIQNTYKQASELAQQHIEKAQEHIEEVGAQINRTAEQVTKTADRMIEGAETASSQHVQMIQTVVASVQDAAKTMIAETRNMSTQHQQDIAQVVDTIQRATETAAEKMIESTETASNQHLQMVQSVVESVQGATQNMISETRNMSVQHQDTITSIVNAVQQASERCATDTQETLTKMATDNAQIVSDAVARIMESWGQNIIGLGEELANRINDRQR